MVYGCCEFRSSAPKQRIVVPSEGDTVHFCSVLCFCSQDLSAGAVSSCTLGLAISLKRWRWRLAALFWPFSTVWQQGKQSCFVLCGEVTVTLDSWFVADAIFTVDES